MFLNILLAYVVTVVSETTVLVLLVKEKPLKEKIQIGILVNSFTHPIVIYLIHALFAPYLLVEGGVVLVEAVLLCLCLRLNYKKAFFITLFSNTISVVVGILIRLVIFYLH